VVERVRGNGFGDGDAGTDGGVLADHFLYIHYYMACAPDLTGDWFTHIGVGIHDRCGPGNRQLSVAR
jgi:hypothetical protein